MDKKRILFVDDEEGFGQILKLSLEGTGEYEIKVETKGKKAVDAAREFKPDLIFLDIIMPDLDGPAVALQIKADPQLNNIPIVFLTAVVKKEEVNSAEGNIGGYPFIAKPVSKEELLECIHKYLDD